MYRLRIVRCQQVADLWYPKKEKNMGKIISLRLGSSMFIVSIIPTLDYPRHAAQFPQVQII